MEIQQLDLTVRELVAGYEYDGEGGVVGYGGKLEIRPPFQREFIYKGKQRKAVFTSILKGFPLHYGSRPFHALVRRRQNQRRQLPDALPEMQPREIIEIAITES